MRRFPCGLSFPLDRLVAVFGLLFVAFTWRLWIPQETFPQIPLLHWAAGAPLWLEWLAAVSLPITLTVTLFAPQHGRLWQAGWVAFLIAAGVLILIDQHRLQPWIYQFLLMAAVFLCLPANNAAGWLRVLTVGIYLHSALSKCDASFLTSHGQQLVGGLTAAVGISLADWSSAARQSAAALLPAGELLVAAALCWKPSRRIGLCGLILMHALLLLALGPWGLNHHPPVLIWNVFFIVQGLLLFGPLFGKRRLVEDVEKRCFPRFTVSFEMQYPRAIFAQGLVLAAVLLPFLEPWGWFDHWPAWALYASRPERVSVLVDSSKAESLPPEIRQHLQPPRPLTQQSRLRIDRWSLDALGVPIYPEDRFQVGVALAVARQYELQQEIHLILESPADRWTAERSRRMVNGRQAIADELDRFWLNGRPRQ